VPGYLAKASELKAAGVDEVLIYCVNDGAVMDAWAKDQGVADSEFITMMGDPSGEITKQLGMVLQDLPGAGIYSRSKRFALYLVDGVIKLVRVSEEGPNGEEDPAGGAFPELTLAPAIIDAIKSTKGA